MAEIVGLIWTKIFSLLSLSLSLSLSFSLPDPDLTVVEVAATTCFGSVSQSVSQSCHRKWLKNRFFFFFWKMGDFSSFSKKMRWMDELLWIGLWFVFMEGWSMMLYESLWTIWLAGVYPFYILCLKLAYPKTFFTWTWVLLWNRERETSCWVSNSSYSG